MSRGTVSPNKLKTRISEGGKILEAELPFEGPRIIMSLKDAGDMGYRESGVSPERDEFFRTIGLDGEMVITCQQIHSRKVCVVDSPVSQILKGDGVITENRSLALGASAADCMPVFLVDRKKGSFGVVHSGWKGTGIVAEALDIFTGKLGSDKDDMAVILGPSAGVCCYEVEEARCRIFRDEWGASAVEERDGSFFLNLPAANAAILERYGVSEVYEFHECTICNPQYGSFRREGPVDYTRMLALIGYFK